jgi:tetratricopeptide (TPR) repeat protein
MPATNPDMDGEMSIKKQKTEKPPKPTQEDARATASKLVGASQRLDAYSTIFSAQIEAGLDAEAAKTLKLMVSTAEELMRDPAEKRFRGYYMCGLAAAQAKCGLFEKSFSTVDNPEARNFPDALANFYLDVVKAQAKRGMKAEASIRFREGLAIIPKTGKGYISPLDARTAFFIKYIMAAKEAGLPDGVKTACDAALADISKADPIMTPRFSISGCFPAGRLRILAEACDAYRKIAAAQIDCGMKDDAPKTLKRAAAAASGIPDPAELSDIYSDIAMLQAAAGHKSEAREGFEKAAGEALKIDPRRSFAASAFHRILPRADPTDPCAPLPILILRLFFPSITLAYKPARSLAYAAIASRYARAGFQKEAKEAFGLALSEASGIPDADYRCDALCDIALQQGKAGYAGDARKTLVLSESSAQMIDPGQSRANFDNSIRLIGHVKKLLEKE